MKSNVLRQKLLRVAAARGEGGREGQYARCLDEGWCTVSGPFVAIRGKAERPVTTKVHA